MNSRARPKRNYPSAAREPSKADPPAYPCLFTMTLFSKYEAFAMWQAAAA